jgi:hypothetical protein
MTSPRFECFDLPVSLAAIILESLLLVSSTSNASASVDNDILGYIDFGMAHQYELE